MNRALVAARTQGRPSLLAFAGDGNEVVFTNNIKPDVDS